MHIAVPVIDSTGTQRLLHLRSDRARWVRSEVATWAPYAALAATDNGGVAIAYAGLDSSRRSSRNTIFFSTSDAQGNWVRQAMLTPNADSSPVRRLSLYRAGQSYHLFWLQASGDGQSETVFYAQSVSGGTDWKISPVTEPVPGLILGMHAAVASCRHTTVIVEVLRDQRVSMALTQWSGDGLAQPRSTSTWANAGNAGLRVDGGREYLVWSSTNEGGDDAVTRYATRKVC